jgi:hypothetical protein
MATTGKRTRRKNLDSNTTAALAAMTDQGLNRTEAGRVLGLSKAQVDRALDEAKLLIGANAAEYASLHLEAARAAALKGKSAPMEWALERLNVVKAPEVQAPTGGGGPVINIGIMLPGLSSPPQVQLPSECVNVEVLTELAAEDTGTGSGHDAG